MLFYLEVDILYWFNTFPNFLAHSQGLKSLHMSVRNTIISNYLNVIKNSATVRKTNKQTHTITNKPQTTKVRGMGSVSL